MERRTSVVDASVAVKWVLQEEGHREALLLLQSYQEEQMDLLAPHLLLAEVGNALWKRVRRGDLTGGQAGRCFDLLLLNCPILMESAEVTRSALELSILHHRAFYDCLYVAWALEQRCDLVTADRKLFGALHPAYPFVKLLYGQ